MSNSVPPSGQLALLGPAEKLDAAHWPVRGDLAHIALAGSCFVPHYAVPMPHRLNATASLLRTPGGEALAAMEPGTGFDVLDMAGDWAWGQAAEGRDGGGMVGYLPLATLEPVA